MKRKTWIIIISICIIIAIVIASFSYGLKSKIVYEEENKLFVIMLKDENGAYYETDLETFPNNDYSYNSELSYCVNGTNMIWNEDNRNISLKVTGSEKCYVYFDNKYITYNFGFTGAEQKFIVPNDGNYKIEAWGASGGNNVDGNALGGNGAYTSGNIYLEQNEIFYIYIGGYNNDFLTNYNGGTNGNPNTYAAWSKGSGGGATDIRLVSGDWNNITSLNSRIMVSGAGGGGINYNSVYANGANAGGLISEDLKYIKNGSAAPVESTLLSSNQTSINSLTNVDSSVSVRNYSSEWGYFGSGGVTDYTMYSQVVNYNGGAGSGYYGGTLYTASGTVYNGGGGSSFISGHTGAVAITSASNQTPKSGCTTGTTNNACSIHYSGYSFADTVMIDGAGYNWTNVIGSQVAMPNPQGGTYALGTGHRGAGFVKITYIGT